MHFYILRFNFIVLYVEQDVKYPLLGVEIKK